MNSFKTNRVPPRASYPKSLGPVSVLPDNFRELLYAGIQVPIDLRFDEDNHTMVIMPFRNDMFYNTQQSFWAALANASMPEYISGSTALVIESPIKSNIEAVGDINDTQIGIDDTQIGIDNTQIGINETTTQNSSLAVFEKDAFLNSAIKQYGKDEIDVVSVGMLIDKNIFVIDRNGDLYVPTLSENIMEDITEKSPYDIERYSVILYFDEETDQYYVVATGSNEMVNANSSNPYMLLQSYFQPGHPLIEILSNRISNIIG